MSVKYRIFLTSQGSRSKTIVYSDSKSYMVGLDGTLYENYGLPTKPMWESVFDDDVELSIFTGLVDSTGKEIYEGDIIHVGGWRYPRQVVKFYDGAFRGHNQYVGQGYLVYELLKTNKVDVVGNVFENPERLNNDE